MELAGNEAHSLFKAKNYEKMLSIVPEEFKEDWGHFLREFSHVLHVIGHQNPRETFSMDDVKTRFRDLQIWLVVTWPQFNQPPYIHMSCMHTVDLLTRPGAQRSISGYGTQNKEAKNKITRQFYTNFARKNSSVNALVDIFLRDVHAGSFEIREHGSSKDFRHCSRCKQLGHCKTQCTEEVSEDEVTGDNVDPLAAVRDGEALVDSLDDVEDEDIESEEEMDKSGSNEEESESDEERESGDAVRDGIET